MLIDSLHIDCDTCAVRGQACGGCFVAELFGGPPLAGPFEDEQAGAPWAARAVPYTALDGEERAAVDVLRAAGLLARPVAPAAPLRPAAGRGRGAVRRAG